MKKESSIFVTFPCHIIFPFHCCLPSSRIVHIFLAGCRNKSLDIQNGIKFVQNFFHLLHTHTQFLLLSAKIDKMLIYQSNKKSNNCILHEVIFKKKLLMNILLLLLLLYFYLANRKSIHQHFSILKDNEDSDQTTAEIVYSLQDASLDSV